MSKFLAYCYEGCPPEIASALYEEDMEEIRRAEEVYSISKSIPTNENPIPFVSKYDEDEVPF